jgi:tetratricopeptide (TPR) repeat protein
VRSRTLRRRGIGLLLAPCVAAGCAWSPDGSTLAELHAVEPDVEEIRVENSLDQAMVAYRNFLEQTPESALTPEAMRRLADLKLEKEYGLLGDGEVVELPAPDARTQRAQAERDAATRTRAAEIDHSQSGSESESESESERDFERRAAGVDPIAAAQGAPDLTLPGGQGAAPQGPLEAIVLYDRILETYPHYQHNDQVLYQKARAFDELGRNDEAIVVIDRMIAEYPHSRYLDEVQFRRGEYFFTRRKYLEAEESYGAVVRMGVHSQYYELALYKLGWTLYKQELHEEALDQYIALLDYKVSTGYDFDAPDDEADERRVADTYRVISLSFSNLGGAEIVEAYFVAHGGRTYEDQIYSHLGEFYLEKLRYQDAAASYEAFVALHPFHRASPHFGMRVVEIYEKGGFPKLVLESKKDFATRYGLKSEYWVHFEVSETPEVLAYLKSNLEDLANHYHALYQNPERVEDKPANFAEALHWYRQVLASFPDDPETPGIHYQLADLLLENESFGEAAREYEQTAYAYPAHDQSAAAGYAAIYAHREHEKQAEGAAREAVRRDAVVSTLRFVDTFPEHQHAAVVLGAAVDDLYDMKEFEQAIAAGYRLIESYPGAKPSVVRGAWAAVAHSTFDTQDYPQAEVAYGKVLEMTSDEDEKRQSVVDNLAAAIYKQGELASVAEDHRSAADHFLRIAAVAPTSEIRPAAEYDAGAALMRLEDWDGAAAVLDTFRDTHPEHELHEEATKQIAFIYREKGDLSRAADEYERVAAEAEDPELRRDALLLAGELYEDSEVTDRALAVYLDYVRQFPAPIEVAVETRSKIAEIYESTGDAERHREQLREIVAIDGAAGEARTDRVRFLAARAALVLTEDLYHHFDEVALVQPFDRNLQEKQRRMDAALAAFGRLVEYEVGEVTAAATFYMAEVYFDFSQSLLESERPTDLQPAELQDYELVLEEEAYPFEERAIEVHEKNLELMSAGVYNTWIEKSLGRLATVMPGRYAKSEESSGWMEAIDHYAYRAPNAPDPIAAMPGEGDDVPAAAASSEKPEAPEIVEVAPAAPANAADDAADDAAGG